ncbi:NAD-dependent aldehyde dehydrogenase [Actinoalloteichus hymeniacidonis]|uniref:NAD-dependent aldehyde dehydrogenase n=1 Tax=Actinoalloteichus hymeniacidonis TaxID=340345 RepID=A0AAC9HU39_9PSEU|nr:NAD-dependent aldehyde dehydrogenase [Actinoalloteichus hymeniacidonis]
MDAFVPTPRPSWIAGNAEPNDRRQEVRHPYDETEVATICVPDADQIWRAVQGTVAATREIAAVSPHSRTAVLNAVAEGISERAEEFAEIITAENGKPLRWAEVEVAAAASVFRLAAAAVDAGAGEPNRWTSGVLARRTPRGPVLAMTSAEYPLASAARQVAAAIAAGCPVLVAPPLRTPLAALMLGELLAEVDLVDGAFSVLPVDEEATRALADDQRASVLSVSGAREVSAHRIVAGRHLVLELGGVTTALICADWAAPADLDRAADRIAEFGTHQAGQSVAALQRVLVDASVYAEFLPRLVAAMRKLRTGDPHDPEVQVGPLIDEAAAREVHARITEAVEAGAEIVVGGDRSGTTVEPTVLTGVPSTSRLWREPVFGPVLVVSAAADLQAAFAQVEDAPILGRASVFTHDLRVAFQAGTALAVEELVVGDVPAPEARGAAGDDPDRDGLHRLLVEFTVERRTVFAAELP